MMLKFKIANSEDTRYLYDILNNDSFVDKFRLGLQGFDEDLLKSDPYKVSFTGEYEGKTVCFGKITDANSTGYAYMSLVYVIPEERLKGYGIELLTYLETFVKNTWNCHGIEFLTISNDAMDSLAEVCGYQLSGEYENRYFINGQNFPEKRWMKVFENEGKTL